MPVVCTFLEKENCKYGQNNRHSIYSSTTGKAPGQNQTILVSSEDGRLMIKIGFGSRYTGHGRGWQARAVT